MPLLTAHLACACRTCYHGRERADNAERKLTSARIKLNEQGKEFSRLSNGNPPVMASTKAEVQTLFKKLKAVAQVGPGCVCGGGGWAGGRGRGRKQVCLGVACLGVPVPADHSLYQQTTGAAIDSPLWWHCLQVSRLLGGQGCKVLLERLLPDAGSAPTPLHCALRPMCRRMHTCPHPPQSCLPACCNRYHPIPYRRCTS